MFRRITDAISKGDIFVGPLIRYIFNDKVFKDLLVRPEEITWKAFGDVAENFLGNCRTPNYIQLVDIKIKGISIG